VAAKDELDDNKPDAKADAKAPKGAPVIRQVEVAGEDMGSRVLNRHIPAWVISGAIHVVVIGFLVIFMSGEKEIAANTNDLVTTQVEEPKEDDKNLTNEELGLDPTLAAATDAKREEAVNVDAQATEEPVGLPDQPNEIAPMTAVAGLSQTLDAGGSPTDLSNTGMMAQGPGGGGAAFSVPGMSGRSGATKDKMLKSGGGNSESEAAVARGLAWLARKQLKDGSWEFDGSSKDKIASTGLALLPFLAAGETHKFGTKYKDTVKRGLDWLMSRIGSGGGFAGSNNMYSVGIATVALCEAAGMTKDPNVKAKATAAVGYIAGAQGRNGSWGYSGPAPTEGDTSIVGWQVQALASAKLAEIKFERTRPSRMPTSSSKASRPTPAPSMVTRPRELRRLSHQSVCSAATTCKRWARDIQPSLVAWISSSSSRRKRATSTCTTTITPPRSFTSTKGRTGTSSGTRRCATCSSTCKTRAATTRNVVAGKEIRASSAASAASSALPAWLS